MTRRGPPLLALGLPLALFATLPPAAGAEDPPAAGPVPLDLYFKGTVAALDGTKVRLKYDFSTPDQMKDWSEFVPFAVAKDRGDKAEVVDGRLAVRGSTGARHGAEWEGDLAVTCRLIPDGTKDIGAYLAPSDGAADYVTYTLVETNFHAWDNKPGGDSGMMKFGKQFSDFKTGGYTGFRYLAFRMLETPPASGKPIAFAFGRKGSKVHMSVGDLHLESAEPGNRIKQAFPGFYAIKSAVALDDVVVEGTLSARWLKEKQVALKTSKPIEAAPEAVVDPAVAAILDAYRAGKASASRLVDLVKDPARPDADRRAAAESLKAGPRSAVGAAIDLLYDLDLKSRTFGIDVVKALTGKDYGYSPGAPPKARSAAIQRLVKDLEEHPELRQGTGG